MQPMVGGLPCKDYHSTYVRGLQALFFCPAGRQQTSPAGMLPPGGMPPEHPGSRRGVHYLAGRLVAPTTGEGPEGPTGAPPPQRRGPRSGHRGGPRPKLPQQPEPPELSKTNILKSWNNFAKCLVLLSIAVQSIDNGHHQAKTTTRGARGPRSGHRRFSGEGPTGAPGGRRGTGYQVFEEPSGASAAVAAPLGGFAARVGERGAQGVYYDTPPRVMCDV